ncbi:MAG: hypothetical protein ACKN9J_00530 [Holophagaceae bacterium]|jgi:hypothetical protein
MSPWLYDDLFYGYDHFTGRSSIEGRVPIILRLSTATVMDRFTKLEDMHRILMLGTPFIWINSVLG